MSKPKALEDRLFTWESWDEDGPMNMAFYRVTLVQDVGPFKKGEKFAAAQLLGDQCVLVLMREGRVWEFGLSLEVVPTRCCAAGCVETPTGAHWFCGAHLFEESRISSAST